jgi:hypothetical protein
MSLIVSITIFVLHLSIPFGINPMETNEALCAIEFECWIGSCWLETGAWITTGAGAPAHAVLLLRPALDSACSRKIHGKPGSRGRYAGRHTHSCVVLRLSKCSRLLDRNDTCVRACLWITTATSLALCSLLH